MQITNKTMSKLFERVDEIASAIKLPFAVRPLEIEKLKIPYTTKTIGGLKLRKFGKVTALESGILASFRLDYVAEVNDIKTRVAALFVEMRDLLGVDNLDELQNLLVDSDKLLEFASKNEVEAQQISDWTDRFIETGKLYNTDSTKLLMDLNLITFIVAMRGDNPEWDYEDTYSNLTSDEMQSILEFLYAEEGINAEETPAPKKLEN
jgi:hypothetical protein